MIDIRLHTKGFKEAKRRKECGTRDAKSVRAVCARRTDPHATRGCGVRALRARDASQRRRAAGAQDEKKWESE